jgi:tubulysin polyketide synthase-like protein
LIAAVEAIKELTGRGVFIWVEDERLKYRGPSGAIPPALAKSVRSHKQEIISLLLNRVVELIVCPGDECGALVLLVDGRGYCYRHNMAITILSKLM